MKPKQIRKPIDKTNFERIAITSIELHNSNIVEISNGKLKNINSLPVS